MNKDRIKDRILKRAAREWGSREVDSQNAFDPVMAIMLNAVSSELEKLYGEFNNTQKRVIERILEIIFPDTISGVYPSRAIIHAEPLENNFPLSIKHHLLSCNKKINNVYDPANPIIKKVAFGPTSPFVSHAAKIEYFAYENSFFRAENFFSKTKIATAKKHLEPGIMWMGIKCLNNAVNFKDLMLYVDSRNNSQKDYFFYNLKQAKCFFGDQEIGIKEGYNIEIQNINIESIIKKNYTHIDQISSEINEFFEPNFITLQDSISLEEQSKEINIPISDHFETEIFKQEKDIIWLKFVFPETLVGEILENVQFSLNCFPFFNKEYYQTRGRAVNPYFYIPLKTSDYFLDLDTVISDSGINYHLKEFADGILEEGSGTVRKSGVSRFDERDASELLSYLLALIKDEVGAFSGIGGDFTIESMRSISQHLASIYQNIKENNSESSNAPYLMVKKKGDSMGDVSLNVTYWGTSGEDANDIKPQTALHFGADFFPGSAYLITPTFAGERQMNSNDRILSYRSAMLTRGRVVTIADIKAFALNHFKASIKKVEVAKGTKKENSNKEGFSRTIDVKITKNAAMGYEIKDAEWKYLCDSFLLNIKKVSSNIYPYRLIID